MNVAHSMRRLAAIGLAAGWVGSEASAVEVAPEAVAVGRLATEPVLDGRLSPAEGWPQALRLPLGDAELRVAWWERWLVLGLRSPIPPAGLLQRVRPRETGDAWSALDDSIEIWLGGASDAEPLARVILNANGAIWDARYRFAADGWSEDSAWRAEAASASRVDRETWTSEIRVALPEGARERGIRMRWVQRAQRPERLRSWPASDQPVSPSAPLALLVLAERAGRSPAPASARADADPPCPERWSAAQEAIDFRIAWLPYRGKLRLRVDVSALPDAQRVASAAVVLRRRNGEEAIWRDTLQLETHEADVVREIPELADGEYEVAVEVGSGAGCPPLVGPTRRFEQRRFGWEHNGLGEGDAVIPPFTPLVVDGRRVEAVLRQHDVGELGLPDRITSAGASLLAGPAYYRVRVDGRDVRPEAEHPVRLVRVSPGRVRSEAQWRAAGLRASSHGVFEIDGMWRIDLELSGGGVRIEQLDLVIPLRAEAATLLNAINEGTLHHTLGRLPQGEGAVWSSLDARHRRLSPEFVPYVWIGDEERGLAWFAESRRGWWPAPGRPAQELVRRGDIVELVVHFVSRPAVLDGTRRIRFGLQATPVKPRVERPEPWRKWQVACRAPFDAFLACSLGSGLYWGAPSAYGNHAPRDDDYSFLEYLGRVRRGAAPSPRRADAWLRDRGVDLRVEARVRDSLLHALRTAAAQPDSLQLYVNLHSANWTPAFAVYLDEWRSEPFGDRAGGDANPRGEIKVRASPSWNDFVLWHLERLLDTGAADGFFFDNTFLKEDFNDVEGPAYRDEQGVLHAGVDLFALRELLKRAQVLTYRKRGAWLNIAHMTTTPVAPVQAWSGVSVDGEWKYGDSDYQARFSRDLLRAGSLGTQTGTVSAYLPGLTGSPPPARRRHLERSLAGVTAVHEIRVMARLEGPLATIWQGLGEFGYGDPDATVRRYWDRDRGFALSGVDAEGLVVARNGRALALLVSFGAAGEVDLVFDADGPLASLRPGGSCRDFEGARGTVTALPRGCRVRLDRHDFRLVAYESPGARR